MNNACTINLCRFEPVGKACIDQTFQQKEESREVLKTYQFVQ